MRHSMYNDDFEDFLKEQVNQHRIYPSDSVWKNIRNDLHGYTKWPALSVVTILVISALVIGTVLNKPKPDALLAGYHFSLTTTPSESGVAGAKTNSSAPLDEHLAVEQITRKTISEATEKIKIETALLASLSNNDMNVLLQPEKPNIQLVAVPAEEKNNAVKTNAVSGITNAEQPVSKIDLTPGNFETTFRTILFKSSTEKNHSYELPANINFAKRTIADITLPGKDRNNAAKTKSPLDRLKKTSSRFDFRFYVTPSISYRVWNQDKDAANTLNSNALPLEANYSVDPENAIQQRPAAGYETGFGLGYSLSKRLSVISGFQFNISQYKVDAYSYKTEPTSITVVNDGFVSNSIATYSSLRSISGNTPITLTNRYYEISVPVGIDWKVLNKNKFTIGLGAAIQPTYTFDKEPLIISSNFKNYADGSDLIRNWNANANIETYFGYSTGNYRWQIGPQLRYQLLPTFISNYPNKEYLFNYGLKIGVVKSLK